MQKHFVKQSAALFSIYYLNNLKVYQDKNKEHIKEIKKEYQEKNKENIKRKIRAQEYLFQVTKY